MERRTIQNVVDRAPDDDDNMLEVECVQKRNMVKKKKEIYIYIYIRKPKKYRFRLIGMRNER